MVFCWLIWEFSTCDCAEHWFTQRVKCGVIFQKNPENRFHTLLERGLRETEEQRDSWLFRTAIESGSETTLAIISNLKQPSTPSRCRQKEFNHGDASWTSLPNQGTLCDDGLAGSSALKARPARPWSFARVQKKLRPENSFWNKSRALARCVTHLAVLEA